MKVSMRVSHALCLAALLSLWSVAAGQSSPSLDAFPIDQWLKHGPVSKGEHMKWSLYASNPLLSESQHLVVTVSVQVMQPVPPQLIVMMQIRDRDRHTYRSQLLPSGFRGQKSRLAPEPGASREPMWWADRVFLTPGDYEIVVALYNIATAKHSVQRTHLHVTPLSRDPFPASWRDAPGMIQTRNIEFLPKLWLPVETKRPVRMEVILNQPVEGDQTDNLLARLEVLSQMTIRNGSMGIRVLDLPHQKVLLSREAGAPLDMRPVGDDLGNPNPLIVHADILSKYEEGAQFFVEQVRAALANNGPQPLNEGSNDVSHVVIVLSAPWDFPMDPGVPVARAELPSRSRVFYLRCDSASYVNGMLRMDRNSINNADSLAGTVKLLPARIFEVFLPADFRQALAEIIREIARID